MAIVTPTNKEVLGFEGLHLYHASYSNCSMRVRMTLEEKGLPWSAIISTLRKVNTLRLNISGSIQTA